MTIVIMGPHTGLQLFALLNLNKATIILYGWMTPHVTKERKWLEYFNEVMVMFLSYSMLCMTSFLLDDDVIFNIGYVFISIFGFLIAGNLTYISWVIFEKFRRE